MKNGTVAALLVVAILAGASGGYLAGMSAATVSSSISTACTVPDEGEVVLQVMNSTSGKPIASVPVQGQLIIAGCPSPDMYTAADLNPALTNATGFVVFAGELGEYHLYLPALGNYFVDVSMNPGQTACVTLSIPSGETDITYTGLLGSSCRSFL